MLITDLLEALNKHGEDNIEFHLITNIDGGSKIMEPVFIDGSCLLKVQEFDGSWRNSVGLQLCKKEDIERLKEEDA